MSELRFEWKNMLAADLGEESCVPDLLGERILQNSLSSIWMKQMKFMKDMGSSGFLSIPSEK